MGVRIITDSAADVSEEFAQGHGIAVAPLKTIFPDGEYVQGKNLTATEFYEKLIESTEVPRTSQVTPTASSPLRISEALSGRMLAPVP